MGEYVKRTLSNAEAVSIIKDYIESDKPMFLIRLGDGELNMLKPKENQNIQFLNKLLQRMGTWPDSQAERQKYLDIYVNMMVEAIKSADIIGITTEHITSERVGISASVDNWSISETDIKIHGIDLSKKEICDHRLHLSKEFGNVNSLKNILNGRPIHVIGHYVDYLQENKLHEVLECPITYTTSPAMYYKNRKSVEDNLHKIQEKIVLIGSGGVGKTIGKTLKEKYGKIVIDVGSLLDAWAGVYTRPWFGKLNPDGSLIKGPNSDVVFSNKINKNRLLEQ
jgi:hypothetical protein